MEKLKMHTPDFTNENIARIAELFPNCVTESRAAKGEVKRAIDFDQLRQELSGNIVEGPQERYQLNWPGKREALLTANVPIAKTLRPCREESVDFDTTKNLFIEGDNLDALKLLQETYLGKVKMIYIDPPYNTGNDFIYEDDFAEDKDEYFERSMQTDEDGNRMTANNESNGRFHSDWLSMMYPRLKLARNLLRDDGVIFISIDDNEQANLKRICDEVFGEDNFLATIIWEKAYSPINLKKHFSPSHDYVMCYARNVEKAVNNGLKRTTDANDRYQNPDNDPRGEWKPATLSVGPVVESQVYEITTPSGRSVFPPSNYCWMFKEDRYQEMVNDGRIWFGPRGDNVPALKRFLSEVKQTITPMTIWKYADVGHSQDAMRALKKLFDDRVLFDYPKPVALIGRMMELYSDKDSIILDFFSGSATTAHAVMQLNAEDGGNRQFIMVQLPEETDEKSEAYKAGYKTIAEIGKERIRRAGNKIRDERQETGDKSQASLIDSDSSLVTRHSSLDIGFRVLKIDSSNMKDVYYSPDEQAQANLLDQVTNIKEDRTAEDLLFQVLLDWGVDLTLPIVRENISTTENTESTERSNKSSAGSVPSVVNKEFEVFFVDENALAACFDDGVSDGLIKELAKRQPLRVVFRDSGFATDAAKINAEQIFKQMSPATEVRSI